MPITWNYCSAEVLKITNCSFFNKKNKNTNTSNSSRNRKLFRLWFGDGSHG